MKKTVYGVSALLLCLVLCFALLPARAAAADPLKIDESHFPDGNFVIYIQDTLDKDLDGYLSDEEIAAVTALKFDRYDDILSLDGIGYFTALKSLRCTGMELTALDISSNTALTTLDCSENKLTALDVSRNTALQKLICNDNLLKTLDVSECTALKELNCSRNELTGLDVSANTKLTSLQCYCNEIPKLDVSGNTALKKLDCSINQLKELDVRSNTALTELLCAENLLTTLDVKKNTALKHLECGQNRLTELDISKCTGLTNLSCNDNKLTKLNISRNTALQILYCQNNRLTALNVRYHSGLKQLFCQGNKIEKLEINKASGLYKAYTKGTRLVTGQTLQYEYYSSNSSGPVICRLYVPKTAKISVTAVPTVTAQPKSASVSAGSKVTFKVKATGTGLKYQWYCQKAGTSKWTAISKATKASYTFTAKKSQNGWKYRCKITCSAGTVTSNYAKLTVK